MFPVSQPQGPLGLGLGLGVMGGAVGGAPAPGEGSPPLGVVVGGQMGGNGHGSGTPSPDQPIFLCPRRPNLGREGRPIMLR